MKSPNLVSERRTDRDAASGTYRDWTVDRLCLPRDG